MGLKLKLTRTGNTGTFMSIRILLFFLIVFFYSSANAQSFTASVEATTVTTDEVFQISFTFSGNEVNGLSNFQAPVFKEFQVVSGPNQSTSMQIINGAVTASRSFSYFLQPRSKGKFTIGSASIQYQGKTLKTEPITIEVVQGGTKQNPKSGDEQISTQQIAENLYIRASVDKNTVYMGEQVTVTYKLYTRLNMSSPQISKMPQYQGFWAEEVESPTNILFTREVINGRQFNSALLKKVALFPTESGDLSVTPFPLKIPVLIERRRKSNGFFDDFFNDPFFRQTETIEYNAVSNTVKVKVLPLPTEGRPENFSGAVGNFDIKMEIDRQKFKQHEPFTLRLIISGTGNIQLLQLPELELPASFEKYDPKISDEIIKSGKLGGKKVFEYLIIPRSEGNQILPPVEFSYFDPVKKKYVTLSIEQKQITVEKGNAEYSGKESEWSKEEIQLLNQEIRYIKTSYSEIEDKSILDNGFVFWMLFTIPFALTGSMIVWKRRELRLSQDMNFVRNRKAERLAKSKLKIARKLLSSNESEKFYAEISAGIYGYLENKLNIERSQFNRETLEETMNKAGVSNELTQKLIALIDHCEFVRYAPSGSREADMANTYKSAVDFIVEAEGTINVA